MSCICILHSDIILITNITFTASVSLTKPHYSCPISGLILQWILLIRIQVITFFMWLIILIVWWNSHSFVPVDCMQLRFVSRDKTFQGIFNFSQILFQFSLKTVRCILELMTYMIKLFSCMFYSGYLYVQTDRGNTVTVKKIKCFHSHSLLKTFYF